MVGQISYTEEQILFILEQTLANEKRDVILHEYQKKFHKSLSVSQLRYVKSKYGHDPEFGTAMVNRKLPKNGGNRKTAKPPLQDTSQNLPSLEEQAQSQPQDEAFPQYQSQASAPELSGTYWFDQYAPTAYKTPYGYQPVLHYYNQLLYPSTAQKRQHEESVKLLPALTPNPKLTRAWHDPSYLPATVHETASESEAKRTRLEPQGNTFTPIPTATPSQMPMNDLMYQAMEQSSTHSFDVAHPERPITPTNPTVTGNALYTDGDESELSPCSQLIKETDPENRPGDPMPTPPSLQMPRDWNDNACPNDTLAQEPASMTTPMSTAVLSPPTSADASLTFSDTIWSQFFDETEFSLQNNHEVSFSHSPQLYEAYDQTLDPAFDQVIEDTSQTPAGESIAETGISGYGWAGENQGQSASAAMTVPQQFDFSNDDSFSSSLEDFDWRACFSPGNQA
ncbi:uncharacterized protein ColSpa_03320 [Colletotrichum spaethianum]|uniref:Clr5 domain-containing protein n=1 Tax=Colletotrichum spaethianum TaxID=700344 RepID=A0AA37LAQ3_9PEZI|nr:uncharacterized protein ColSpa_03320 [Colletotrichum spaethianum]GKT43139.1 hypothetical protein ColSpa_03320 [Colletotrichum spaethianum]